MENNQDGFRAVVIGVLSIQIYCTPILGLFLHWDVKSGREMESEIVKRQLAFPTKNAGKHGARRTLNIRLFSFP